MDLPRGLGGVEGICKRYELAAQKRALFASLYRGCYRFGMPSRQLFIDFAPGQEKENELFDSTAVNAVKEFASRLQANICPPWRHWSILEPGPDLPPEQQESDQIIDGLQKQTKILFSYLNHSNFTLKSHEAFLDLAAGTGAIVEDLNDTQDGIIFDCVPSARLAIEESPYGSVETVYEDKKLTLRSIKRLYGGKVELPQAWAREKEETEKDFVQGVVYEPKRKSYHLCLFAKNPKFVMYARDLGPSSPYIVFRWSVIAGEVFGRGPLCDSLADIRTLNTVIEYMLRGAALTLAPPMTGRNDGILNPFTAFIAPDTIIPVASNDQANPSLRVLLDRIDVGLGQFVLTELRENVRKSLLADPRRREGPIESATEVLVEDREFVMQAGAAYGRVQSEFIEKVIARSVHLLQSIGKMAKIKVDGKEVTLKHTSPLARAQDTEDLQNLGNAVALATAAAGPEMYQLAVKTDEIPGHVFKKAGIPAELVRSPEERTEKANQITAAAMAAQQPPASQGMPMSPLRAVA